MRNPIMFLFICVCLLFLNACSEEEEPVVLEDEKNPIRMEIEQVIEEKDIVEIWAVDIETCANISFYDGTEDFEFMDYFLRIQDTYYRYERLVSFETESNIGGNQMLLCFN